MDAPAIRILTPRHPTDLGLTLGPLRFGGRDDPSIAIQDGEAWRASRHRGEPATTHFVREGDSFRVEAWGTGAEAALDEAPDLLGMDDDPAAFAPDNALLRDLHARFAGLRISRSGAVVESMVPTIFGQKVIGAEAQQGYVRMVRALGEPAPGPWALLLPVAADTLAHLGYYDLHPFGLERRRAETVIRVARLAKRLEECATMPLLAARDRLLAIPGIGPWSTAEVLARALGDPDAVPVGDYNLPNTVCWALAGEARGNDGRMLELLEPFGGQRGRAIRLIEAAYISAPRRGPRLPFRHLERG